MIITCEFVAYLLLFLVFYFSSSNCQNAKKNEDHREQETKGIGSKLGKKLHRGENPKKYPLLIE